MHRFAKRFVAFLVVLGVLVVALNWRFFWLNAAYTFGERPAAATTAASSTAALLGRANYLAVPSLGIAAPVVYLDKVSKRSFGDALKEGVVHYPATAEPGQAGNAYIFGHSSDFVWSKGKYKTVFALLPRIETGAKIYVSNPAGQTFEYQVYERFVTSATDTESLSQGDYRERLLTLQTSYPIGTAWKRYIVRAVLVE